MAVSGKWYGLGATNVLGGDVESETPAIDLLTNQINIALLHSGYTPNQDTHETWADVSTYECATTGGNSGYTSGGEILAHKTVVYTPATNIVAFDNTDDADSTWHITGTFDVGKVPRYAVVYRYNATAGLKLLLGYIDFGEDKPVTDSDFAVIMDAAGILKLTVTA